MENMHIDIKMKRIKCIYYNVPKGRCWAILRVTVLPDCLIVSTISP